MWASKSKLSSSRCFWAVQVNSLPLSWQLRASSVGSTSSFRVAKSGPHREVSPSWKLHLIGVSSWKMWSRHPSEPENVDLLHVSLKRFAPKVLWSSKSCSCSPRSFYSMFALCSPSKFSFWSRTTHTRTYKQAILAKLICFFSTRLQAKTLAHFRWNEERNCWHIETVQYSWGHVHPWGDKGYSLKTCRVKVFTWAIEIHVIT